MRPLTDPCWIAPPPYLHPVSPVGLFALQNLEPAWKDRWDSPAPAMKSNLWQPVMIKLLLQARRASSSGCYPKREQHKVSVHSAASGPGLVSKYYRVVWYMRPCLVLVSLLKCPDPVSYPETSIQMPAWGALEHQCSVAIGDIARDCERCLILVLRGLA